MSNRASLATDEVPFDVACPTCGSLPGEYCKALTTGRTTTVHEKRFAVSFLWRAGNATR